MFSSAADENTLGALVSIFGSRLACVGVQINNSVRVHGDEGTAVRLVDVLLIDFGALWLRGRSYIRL